MHSKDLAKALNEAHELLEDSNLLKAFVAFKNMTRKWPWAVPAWIGYGRAAVSLGQMDVANKAWRKAKELQPRELSLLLEIGHQYEMSRNPEQARVFFQEAVAVSPTAINPRICLALIEEKQHRFAEARIAVEQCLRINDADEQARYMKALLDHRENLLDQAERQLRALILSNPKHEYVRYAARYELAQILDKTGRYDEAMQMLVEAKEIVRSLVDIRILAKQYDHHSGLLKRAAERLPKNILRTWAKTFPRARRKPIPRLAFLGGHPRSGTTLLEQVLGSHPEVEAIDEPFVAGIAANASFGPMSAFFIASLNVVRDRYISALRQALGPEADGRLLLEKNPSPTAQLPSLLRVFPELRVIIALRDPRDVVLSCYFQNIPLNNVNANFLSLDRLAIHYANLMDVWIAVREWEDFPWIETRYENTISDLDSEGRRVTAFLGLEWHGRQARYYEETCKKRLYSPTYHDVTQPVYSRSVARWRHYENTSRRSFQLWSHTVVNLDMFSAFFEFYETKTSS